MIKVLKTIIILLIDFNIFHCGNFLMCNTICENSITTLKKGFIICVNDPSAGSPTETLLRLLLPLNDKV